MDRCDDPYFISVLMRHVFDDGSVLFNDCQSRLPGEVYTTAYVDLDQKQKDQLLWRATEVVNHFCRLKGITQEGEFLTIPHIEFSVLCQQLGKFKKLEKFFYFSTITSGDSE